MLADQKHIIGIPVAQHLIVTTICPLISVPVSKNKLYSQAQALRIKLLIHAKDYMSQGLSLGSDLTKPGLFRQYDCG